MGSSEKIAADRMRWTEAHADHVQTGRQARAWLRALARRMRTLEDLLPGLDRHSEHSDERITSALTAARTVLRETYEASIAQSLRIARKVARRFLAPEPPRHLIELRELSRNPWRSWEYVNWWAGMAKLTHTVPQTAGGIFTRGVRDFVRAVLRRS